jgi:hypothetical protein
LSLLCFSVHVSESSRKHSHPPAHPSQSPVLRNAAALALAAA